MTGGLWRDESKENLVAILLPLPVGWTLKTCPQCGGRLSGAIVLTTDGVRLVQSADEADPNIVCLNCGYWFDD